MAALLGDESKSRRRDITLVRGLAYMRDKTQIRLGITELSSEFLHILLVCINTILQSIICRYYQSDEKKHFNSRWW